MASSEEKDAMRKESDGESAPKRARLEDQNDEVNPLANINDDDKEVEEEEEDPNDDGEEGVQGENVTIDFEKVNEGDDKEVEEEDPSDDGEEGVQGENVTIDLENVNEGTLMGFLRNIASQQGVPLSVLWNSLQSQEDTDEDEEIEYPFEQLPTTLKQVAEFIQSDKCQRILILAGAGMSVAAGIPDYRSENGFYATLPATRLTATPEQQQAIQQDKTVALDHHLFLQNQLPCLELKRDFILGVQQERWKPTLAHHFCSFLASKMNRKLVRWYTQNIDGLEDLTLLGDKVLHVHGTMSKANCARCGAEYDTTRFGAEVEAKIKDVLNLDPKAPEVSTPIPCQTCGAHAVKPAIVLFRSSLPRVFFDRLPQDTQDIDLLLVLGTSLKVAPANSIVWRVPKSCLRVSINREPVGQHLGMRTVDDERNHRDFHVEGDCEDIVLELMDHLGWLSDIPIDQLPVPSAAMLKEKLDGKTNNETEEAVPAKVPPR